MLVYPRGIDEHLGRRVFVIFFNPDESEEIRPGTLRKRYAHTGNFYELVDSKGFTIRTLEDGDSIYLDSKLVEMLGVIFNKPQASTPGFERPYRDLWR